MNFLPADALGVTDGERVGFRPEWATLDTGGPLSGTVARLRTPIGADVVHVVVPELDRDAMHVRRPVRQVDRRAIVAAAILIGDRHRSTGIR